MQEDNRAPPTTSSTGSWTAPVDDLPGRVAVVTGAASGLGRAMAERFAAEGMRIVVSDIDPAGLDEVARTLTDAGSEVHAVVADVADHGDVDRLADESFARFGAVHLLCNNAGVVKSARPGR